MSPPIATPPAEEEGLSLHRRLCERQATAPPDFSSAYLGPLTEWLRGRCPGGDPHHHEEAAGQALLDFCEHPERYDPGQLSLFSFLCMAARRDLLNLRQKEARHHRGRVPGDFSVELAWDAGNYL